MLSELNNVLFTNKLAVMTMRKVNEGKDSQGKGQGEFNDNVDNTNPDSENALTQKDVCGMWLHVGIPYMVKNGRSDQLSQWERDWYEEKFEAQAGVKV